MKAQQRLWLLAALTCVVGAVHAQTGATGAAGTVTVDPSTGGVTPYLLDSQRMIVRNNAGQCWRTGFWTAELAARTKVVGSQFPAGCACDEPLMPAGTCTPPPAPVVAQAAPAPAPAPLAAPRAEKVTIPTDTLFAFDKAVLTSEGRDRLSSFAQQLQALNLEAVIAIGHTDRIGTTSYNQRLSEQRAAAVKNYLVQQGVPSDRIYTEARGEGQPVTGDKCANMGKENSRNKSLVSCLAPDRRVEVEAVGVRK